MFALTDVQTQDALNVDYLTSLILYIGHMYITCITQEVTKCFGNRAAFLGPEDME
jgi:hypothetical protein